MKKTALLFVVFMAPSVSHVYAGESTDADITCTCIAATSMCNFKLYDEAAGKPRITWAQKAYQNPALPPLSSKDLAEACWRKRDANPGGEGLCCAMDNNESDASRYFKGEHK